MLPVNNYTKTHLVVSRNSFILTLKTIVGIKLFRGTTNCILCFLANQHLPIIRHIQIMHVTFFTRLARLFLYVDMFAKNTSNTQLKMIRKLHLVPDNKYPCQELFSEIIIFQHASAACRY